VSGIGGKGIVPGRLRDSFGVAWARTEFSGHVIPFLRDRLGLGFDREDAIEVYYNAALTGWLDATLDLQIVDTGQARKLDGSGRRLEDMGTAVVPGLRLYARF
jgi:porin